MIRYCNAEKQDSNSRKLGEGQGVLGVVCEYHTELDDRSQPTTVQEFEAFRVEL